MSLSNPVYSTVTIVKIGNRDDFGTGFFYNFLDKTYLVTNNHVIDPKDAQTANEIRYFTRQNEDITSLDWHTISIDGAKRNWSEPHHNSGLDYNIDLAVIPVEQALSPLSELVNNSNPNLESGSLAFTPEMVMTGGDIVAGGDVVLVIGYPDGLLDSDSYWPLLRDARISTPFGDPFQGEPKFITDALMMPGMSGSPIVAGPRTLKNPATGGLRTSSRGFALLGVHSDNYPRISGESYERLNLNAGWYAQMINYAILEYLTSDFEDVEELVETIEDNHPDALKLTHHLLPSLVGAFETDSEFVTRLSQPEFED